MAVPKPLIYLLILYLELVSCVFVGTSWMVIFASERRPCFMLFSFVVSLFMFQILKKCQWDENSKRHVSCQPRPFPPFSGLLFRSAYQLVMHKQRKLLTPKRLKLALSYPNPYLNHYILFKIFNVKAKPRFHVIDSSFA